MCDVASVTELLLLPCPHTLQDKAEFGRQVMVERGYGKFGDRRYLARQALRAANGAGLGAVAGALIGGILGGGSAFVVDLVAAVYFHSALFSTTYARYWPFCSLAGLVPGIMGGALIGTLIVVPTTRKRQNIAALLGSGCGLADAGFNRTYVQPPNMEGTLVLTAMTLSGLLGGLLLSGFLGVVRRRWRWWTRWETNVLPTGRPMPRGGSDQA
jgi:hypothetical protein